MIYRLRESRPGDPEAEDEAVAEQISDSLARRRGADYFASYRSGLRDTAEIEIFEENL